MNGEQTLNYESKCQRETTNLTETIVTDICNGKVQHVPNGIMDIGFMLLVGVMLISIAGMFIGFATMMFRETF